MVGVASDKNMQFLTNHIIPSFPGFPMSVKEMEKKPKKLGGVGHAEHRTSPD